jgi:hypothetical protein
MVVPQALSVVLYGAAVAGDHPDIDTPDNLSKFSGFLRIGAIILLLVGFATAVMNFSGSAMGAAVFAFVVVLLLGMYDYTIIAKKKRKAAKDTVAKAGREYLETKKEVEKGPDQVTNVQGDVVDRKHQQTNVDRSTTNVDTIDQSTTNVDQSKTVKDQRTQVEDSVVNRSDITASAEGGDRQPRQGGENRRAGGTAGGQPGGQGNGRPEGNRQQPTDQQPRGGRQSGGGQGGTATGGHGSGGGPRYCPGCGDEVEPDWNTCISCGYDL